MDPISIIKSVLIYPSLDFADIRVRNCKYLLRATIPDLHKNFTILRNIKKIKSLKLENSKNNVNEPRFLPFLTGLRKSLKFGFPLVN